MQTIQMPDRVTMMQALADDAEGPRPYARVKPAVRPEDPGMYGVQTWSAGPIYPAILHVEEEYLSFEDYAKNVGSKSQMTAERFYAWDLEDRMLSRQYVLTIPGCEPVEFDSRGAAETYALRMQGGAA